RDPEQVLKKKPFTIDVVNGFFSTSFVGEQQNANRQAFPDIARDPCRRAVGRLCLQSDADMEGRGRSWLCAGTSGTG
ncbi:hypothetical protein, partial [Herbaspirillum chlorophenolicum]|uniref:hypothetical protein n=1 Tax=Herbaspirillum chlorophenolicum TaxID=211589 RepID=UPI001FD0E852